MSGYKRNPGLFVLVYLLRFICYGLFAMVYLLWFICYGLLINNTACLVINGILVYLLWFIGYGLLAMVYLPRFTL